jgi:hypothetical protein
VIIVTAEAKQMLFPYKLIRLAKKKSRFGHGENWDSKE